jgi:predicted GNAT family acetyltransferase
MILSDFKLNEAELQFELKADGQLAFLEYHREDERLYLTHTEVPTALRGQGVAAELVKEVLGFARQNGLSVIPLCSYVAYFMNNHQEWNDILSEGYQM